MALCRKGRPPVGTRLAKVGEIAMSLSGSPIKPISVNMNIGNGKVRLLALAVSAGRSFSSLPTIAAKMSAI